MNKKISAVVTLVGLILIMCAMAVLFHNKKEDNLAKKSSNTVLSSLKEKIEESNLKTSEEEKDLNKDLNQYDGYIKIPKLNLELPVMKKPTQANLKKSPCIYSGTAKDSNLIIAAHNYSAHFGKINQLENGDCIEKMGAVADRSIDLILTDPPYNLGNFMKNRDTNLKKMRRIMELVERYRNNPQASKSGAFEPDINR